MNHRTVVTKPVIYENGPLFTVKWKVGNQERSRDFPDIDSAKQCAGHVRQLSVFPEILLSSTKLQQIFVFMYQRMGEARLLELLESEAGGMEQVSLLRAVPHYLAMQRDAGRSYGHLTTLKCHLKKLTEHCGNIDIALVNVRQLEQILNRYPVAKTRSSMLRSYCAFFNYAVQQNWLAKNVALRIPPPKIVQAEFELFEPDEMRKLLAAAAGHSASTAFLVLGGFCGVRSAEIFRLTAGNYKRDAASLVCPCDVTKTARRRVVQLEPNAVAWLNSLIPADADPDAPLLPVEHELRIELRGVIAASGVEWRKNALRHSYASYHLEKFSDAARTAKNCGHSVVELETVYMQLTTKAEAEDWFSIFPGTTQN